MRRSATIGICAGLLCLLALATAVISARQGHAAAGAQSTRASGPATETFHIAPGGPGYTTSTVFEQGREYGFVISGTIVADEGGGQTSTLSAYHCLSGTFCDPLENCDPTCPPAKSPANFGVFDERGLSPSIDDGKASEGPAPADGRYEFVYRGYDAGRLTFQPLPDGRYGGKDATFSGEGFTVSVTSLTPDETSCSIPEEWDEPAAADRRAGCVWQVPFGFDLAGMPERPLPGRLPSGLTTVGVRTHGTKFVAERKQAEFLFTTRGRIEIHPEYRKPGGGTTVKTITLSAFKRPLYVRKPGTRQVLFDAFVTASDDPSCTKDTKLKVDFPIRFNGKSPRLLLEVARGECLIGQEERSLIIWLKKSFDEAEIGDPQPR